MLFVQYGMNCQRLCKSRFPHPCWDLDWLVNVLIRSLRTSERRSGIDLAARLKEYDDRELDDVGFVRTEGRIADASTKLCWNEILQRMLDEAFVNQSVAQLLILDEATVEPNADWQETSAKKDHNGESYSVGEENTCWVCIHLSKSSQNVELYGYTCYQICFGVWKGTNRIQMFPVLCASFSQFLNELQTKLQV